MRSRRIRLELIGVLAVCSMFGGVSAAVAADIINNPGLETGGGQPEGWALTQSIAGSPGTLVSAIEQRDAGNSEFDPQQPGLGLTMYGAAGNNGAFAGQDKAINVLLTRTVAVGAGRTFTLSGDSLLQSGHSGSVDMLGASTPLGDYNLDTVANAADYTIWRDTLGSTTDFRANGTNEGASLDLVDQADYDWWKSHYGSAGHGEIPSPTTLFFRVEFLDAGGNVLGTPSNIDLKAEPTRDAWRTQSLAGIVSPAGTTQARVSAVFNNIVDSHPAAGGQDLYWDNFSLNQTSSPFAGEKLSNPDPNNAEYGIRLLNIVGPPGGWAIESVGGDNISLSGSSTFAAHTGNVGMWLRAFNGGDAKISQTLAATAGGNYAFHAFSKWETNYRGADPASSNETFLRMEFLDAADAVLGTQTLDLKRGLNGDIFVPDAGQQVNDGVWRDFVLSATAPALTAKVRVSAGATGMVIETGPQLSAFFDDFQLIETLAGAAASVVPEPATMALVGMSLLGLMGIRRRGK